MNVFRGYTIGVFLFPFVVVKLTFANLISACIEEDFDYVGNDITIFPNTSSIDDCHEVS